MSASDVDAPRVFLWEDLAFFRVRLSEFLADAGLDVVKGTGASDLAAALRQIAPPPDLLLLPVGRLNPAVLPMVRDLHAKAALPHIPILGVTALDRSGLNLDELRNLGFAGLIDMGALPVHVVFRINQLVRACDPRRRYDRAPAFFPIDVEIAGTLRTEYVLSLSVGGMRFTSGSRLEQNTDFTARFRASEAIDDFIEVRARVLYTVELTSGVSPCEVGAFFYPLNSRARRFLEREVQRLLDGCSGRELRAGGQEAGAGRAGIDVFRMLVVDGSEADRAEIRGLVLEQCGTASIAVAQDGIGALHLLREESVDLVLCSVDTPLLDRRALLELNAGSNMRVRTPVIFLHSNPQDPDREVELIEEGACDVIARPFHPRQLMARIRLQLRTKRLCESLLEENESLAREATTDLLTGLRSRRFLVETLAVELSRARRHDTALSILLVDIDNFKAINDRFGHAAGDVVLNRVAQLLAANTRAHDFAARYGGDELVWVLSLNTIEGVLTCAERLRREVEATPFEQSQTSFQVTISIGVASWDGKTESVDELIARADKALYAAKQSGRNRIEVQG